MNIEIANASLKNTHKEKNGDFIGVYHFNGIDILLLSDGVGGSVGDWMASKTCVTQFYALFKESTTEDINKRISETIDEVNKSILLESGRFKGMKATFVVLLHDRKSKQIYYTSIGDSRIYQILSDKTMQLSKDQTKVIVRRKQDGTPITVSGAIVNAAGVTHVMGATPLDFEVKSFQINENTGFLLASDGFYSKIPDFENTLINTLNEPNLDAAFKSIVNQVSIHQDDDASGIFVRFSDKSKNKIGLKDVLEQNNQFSILELNQATAYLLQEAIENKNDTQAIKLIAHINEHEIALTFDLYDKLIKSMLHNNFNNSDIYQDLIVLLKKSKL